MSITILHTADWQLGKPFGSIESDTAALLREERFEAVKRVAAWAQEHSVDAVLVAGDVFDSSTTPDHIVRRALEAMKAYNGPWVLLPGNHDPAYTREPLDTPQAHWIARQRHSCSCPRDNPARG